ncbi:MAG TPA: hypothetical protein VMC43_03950 [Candidatus Paceibacterota bacterium]|nr:hypothetical protein [Candidatus Paceibacterota bacterium]
MSKQFVWFAIILFVGAVALSVAVAWWPTKYPATVLDAFAQCLSAKNITMYGAAWCPHCQNEKHRFGASFHYVNYVECPNNVQLCTEKGVQGYPTWLAPDGQKLEGDQELEKLADFSGCALPTSTQP